MEKIASGQRGEIYLLEEYGEYFAIKKSLAEEKKAAINKEILILRKLKDNGIDFVPYIVDWGDGYFKYKYITGEPFKSIYPKKSLEDKQKIVLNLLKNIYILDKVGIYHGELNRPLTNILINGTEVYIIDFERGKIYSQNGKNMKLFSQWLMSKGYLNMEDIKKIGAEVDIEKIYNYIKENVKIY